VLLLSQSDHAEFNLSQYWLMIMLVSLMETTSGSSGKTANKYTSKLKDKSAQCKDRNLNG
jgi:hypothetical protein